MLRNKSKNGPTPEPRRPAIATLWLIALIPISGCSRSQAPLQFYESRPSGQTIVFQWSNRQDQYLATLREQHNLDQLIAACRSDFDKVRVIAHWVRSRWEHNGSNTPKKSDPFPFWQRPPRASNFGALNTRLFCAQR